jgi:hypothetical protein
MYPGVAWNAVEEDRHIRPAFDATGETILLMQIEVLRMNGWKLCQFTQFDLHWD